MFYRYPHEFDRTFAAMDQLRRRMSRAFEDFEGTDDAQDERFGPRAAITDRGDKLELKLDLPGVSEKDVSLTVQQDVLTLTGERKADAPDGYHVHRQERQAAKFAKNYALPCKVDPERCTALLKNGTLTLTLAKSAESQPRQIAVRAQ